MNKQKSKSTTRSGALFKPEPVEAVLPITTSDIMQNPGSTSENTGENQLQSVMTALLEDRRAMQDNIATLMRVVDERITRPEATVDPTPRPAVGRSNSEVELKLETCQQ